MFVPLARRAALLVALACAVVLGGCGVDVAKLAHYNAIKGDPLGPASGEVTELDGSTWAYRDPGAGKITLLYFGYTSCPDICPTTMADLAFAMKSLPSDVKSKLQVQFVSTDPDRDTTAQLRSWLAGFDASFRGGRAPIATVIADAQSYGIGIEAPTTTDGNYQVTHGAELLVLNPKGQEVGYFDDLAGHSAYETALPQLVTKYA